MYKIKKLGAVLTVLSAIAYIVFRASTLTSSGSLFNVVSFAIETTCALAFATEAILLSVIMPTKKFHSSEDEIMQSASRLLSSNTTASNSIIGGTSDTKIGVTQETTISKYIEEADVVVFVETATPADLRRNFLSLEGIEGIHSVFVIDPTQSNSTKELCKEFSHELITNFSQTAINTSTYLVCRGVDIIYPDVLNIARHYDFKGKAWLELRSVYSDEHVFGGKSEVVIDDKRQMIRESLSSRSLAPWSTGPAIVGVDKLESFSKVTRAQDFFNICEKNSIHGVITEEIASEELSHEQTFSEILWRNLEMSYLVKSFGAKYSKSSQRILGTFIKIFSFFSVTSILRRLALLSATIYIVLVPKTIEYVDSTYVAISAVLLCLAVFGSYMAGDRRPFVFRVREFYFDIEAVLWNFYKKTILKMDYKKMVNLTKRMPAVSTLLIAADAAIVYRVYRESNLLPGAGVTTISRNITMIAGYALIVSLLFGLSMVVVTQMRKSIRREVSRGAVVNEEPVSMVDLSPGGAGIISSVAYKVGEHVKFKSKLSSLNNEPLECSATVRSCFEKTGNYRVGIEFDELIQDQIDELETYCLVTYPHSLARNTDGVRERNDSSTSKVVGKSQRRALAYACSFVALGSVFYSNISHWIK